MLSARTDRFSLVLVSECCDVKQTLTWKRRQDAGVGTGLLRVFRGVFGLEDLMQVEKLSVSPVDQILTLSFSLHLNHKQLKRKEKRELLTFLIQAQ